MAESFTCKVCGMNFTINEKSMAVKKHVMKCDEPIYVYCPYCKACVSVARVKFVLVFEKPPVDKEEEKMCSLSALFG